PRSPGAPLPLSLIRCPSPTPAGMRAWMVLVLIARPLPDHTEHQSSTPIPRPRQVLHGSDSAKPPRFRLAAPVPSQEGQTRGTVPAFAPGPPPDPPGLGPGPRPGPRGPLRGTPERHGHPVDGVAERQRCLGLDVRAAPGPRLGA